MLAKKTVKNQITLPKKIVDRFPGVEYFNVRTEDDRIVLEPLRMDRAGQVREKLARLGVNEADIADAIAWARKTKRSGSSSIPTPLPLTPFPSAATRMTKSS